MTDQDQDIGNMLVNAINKALRNERNMVKLWWLPYPEETPPVDGNYLVVVEHDDVREWMQATYMHHEETGEGEWYMEWYESYSPTVIFWANVTLPPREEK